MRHLFNRNKINNEDIPELKSPQQELSNDVLHMSIACVHVEQLAIKIFVMLGVILMTTHFLYPITGVNVCMGFLQFFFTIENKILETTYI